MKTIKECVNNLEDVSVEDFYLLCWELHKEGRTGRIRFPKKLMDLYRMLKNDFLSEKHTIFSQLQLILNNDRLKYCNDKMLKQAVLLGESAQEKNK